MSVFPKGYTFIDASYPFIDKIFPILECLGYSYVTITMDSSVSFSYTLKWSFDGIGTDFIETTATSITPKSNTYNVKAKFLTVEFDLNSAPALVRFSLSLNDETPPSQPFTLTNEGVGEYLYDEPNNAIKSVYSSDGSISIIAGPSDINFRYLGGGGPYTQTADDITPVTLTGVNSVLSGITNTINSTTTNSSILGANGSSIVSDSSACVVTGLTNTCRSNNSVILGGRNNQMISNSGTVYSNSNSMLSCQECVINGGGGGVGSCWNSGMFGCYQCYLGPYAGGQFSGNRCCLMASSFSGMTGAIGNSTSDSSIISSNTSFIGQNCDQCSVISSINGFISDTCTKCNIIGGQNCTIASTNTNSNCIGSYLLTNSSGTLMLGDNTNATLNSSSTNRLHARFVNGYYLYTNSAFTTGVSMGAGASSWSSISDINKKENVSEINYSEIYNKVKNIPIYQYNYIGDIPERIQIGPCAQDHYAQFSNYFSQQYLNENQELTYAKDQLSIETNDLIGVLFATVKELQNRVDSLQDTINQLI